MTSVKISEDGGCRKMRNFPTPSDPHFYGSWDKSKNPYPLRNCIIPNSATAGDPGTIQPAAEMFLGPQQVPCWELCDFAMGIGSCFFLVNEECIETDR